GGADQCGPRPANQNTYLKLHLSQQPLYTATLFPLRFSSSHLLGSWPPPLFGGRACSGLRYLFLNRKEREIPSSVRHIHRVMVSAAADPGILPNNLPVHFDILREGFIVQTV